MATTSSGSSARRAATVAIAATLTAFASMAALVGVGVWAAVASAGGFNVRAILAGCAYVLFALVAPAGLGFYLARVKRWPITQAVVVGAATELLIHALLLPIAFVVFSM